MDKGWKAKKLESLKAKGTILVYPRIPASNFPGFPDLF
jgi:hypothetical protein